MKILIIKPSSLGDVIHALRIAYQIKRAYPSARIDWVIKNGLQGILDASGMVGRSLIFNRGRGLLEYLRLMAEIRRGNYELVLDLQGLLRSAVLARFSKGKQIFGVADGREGSVFLYKAVGEKSRKKLMHAIERMLPFLNELGFHEYDPTLPLLFPDSNLSRAFEFLIQDDGFILLFPESRRVEKVWPYFTDLGKALVELSGKRVVVAGNQKTGKFANMVDLRGDLQLIELPDLINRAQVIVSNDSAPLHLASALGKPLVGLFGPTKSLLYGPYPMPQENAIVFDAQDEDIRSISVKSVVKGVMQLVN